MAQLMRAISSPRDVSVDTLILCRTPLQARICLEILAAGAHGPFDLVYFTQDDNESDRTYFSRLGEHAVRREYVHVPRRNPDILNHLNAIWRGRSLSLGGRYSRILLASIDNLFFRHVLKTNPHAVIDTFDDGTANINPGSVFHKTEQHARASLYAAFLRIPSSDTIKRAIRHHYSIYPDFENMLPRDRITYLYPFGQPSADDPASMTFFIGQPFAEAFSLPDIERMVTWLRMQRIDFYVMHPREQAPIIDDTPLLEKRGELAEDAIFAACAGKRPTIIAAFSSVLFNVSDRVADKIYLSLGNGARATEHRRLAEKAGASIVTLAEDDVAGSMRLVGLPRGSRLS